MKNIIYRPNENRYYGRKQIKYKKIEAYGKTLKQCKLNLIKKIREVNNELQIFSTQSTKNHTVISFWEKWYNQHKIDNIADNTKKEYDLVKRKLEPIHNVELKKLNIDLLSSFMKTIDKGGTKDKVYIYLGAMLKQAVKENKIKLNPLDLMTIPKRRIGKKPALSYSQQKIILERLKDEEIKPIYLLYLITGMRRREYENKSLLENLNIEHNFLTTINLKGRENITRYKRILLSKQAIEMIIKNKKVFEKYNEDKFYRIFNEIMTELKIKVSVNNLRHTYATNNFYLGTPELFISRQMGHSTSQITKDKYTDIDYNLTKEKIQKLYKNLYYSFDTTFDTTF